MAFNSWKCVLCTDPTKRNDGMYHGKDEKGKYSGYMYACDNINCSINYERRRVNKQMAMMEEKPSADKTAGSRHNSSSKHRQKKERK